MFSTQPISRLDSGYIFMRSRIRRSILVQFQDMHVAIQTIVSLCYSTHNAS